MGKPNNKGRSKGGRYVGLGHPLVTSPAFRSLGGPAVKVYIELRDRYMGANNGEVYLSYTEASRLLNLGKSTVSASFDELQEKGLLKQTRQGSFYERLASTWAFTDQGLGASLATNEWRRWPHEKQKIAPKNPHHFRRRK